MSRGFGFIIEGNWSPRLALIKLLAGRTPVALNLEIEGCILVDRPTLIHRLRWHGYPCGLKRAA